MWITKYALTIGIEKVEAEVIGQYAYYYRVPGCRIQVPERDWHATMAGAKVRVAALIASRCASIQKSLQRCCLLQSELDAGTFLYIDRTMT